MQANEAVSRDEDKSRVLKTIFFPSLLSVPIPNQEKIEYAWSPHLPQSVEDYDLVFLQAVLCAIQSAHVDEAPSTNDIPLICSKKCWTSLLLWLSQIFSSSLLVGYFPATWRIAKILAL